jgi:tRNA threonylcarbamoyladenosine biosynthesis protein TsaB
MSTGEQKIRRSQTAKMNFRRSLMPHSPILALDTALDACSACLMRRDGTILAQETLPLVRGHAEALLPLIERVMAAAKENHDFPGFQALARVAVTIGPGSYTGLRVGISCARAIGLATNLPVVGVSTLAALVAPLVGGDNPRVLVSALDARHGAIYMQVVAPSGHVRVEPCHMPLKEAARRLGVEPVLIVGSAATGLAREAHALGIDARVHEVASYPQPEAIAKLGWLADPRNAPPRPLYLREADAKPAI